MRKAAMAGALLLALGLVPGKGRAEAPRYLCSPGQPDPICLEFLWPRDAARPGRNLIPLAGEEFPGPGGSRGISWRLPSGEVAAETRVYAQSLDSNLILIVETTLQREIAAPTGVFRQPHFGAPVLRPAARYKHVLTYKIDAFAPPSRRPVATSGPVALYDDRFETIVFSPLDRFLVSMSAPLPDGGWLCGFEGMVERIPAGTVLRELVVKGPGLTDTMIYWGDMVRAWHHRQRADAYADVGLSRLGYWTDNGGYYYYKTAPGKNYHETLMAVAEDARRRGIPYGYFQLDSWWYPKAESSNGLLQAFRGGSLLWEPIPELFPQGLPAFQRELGLPIVAHNRWYNQDSPYCKKYECAYGAGDKRPALPIEPRFWDEIMDNAVKYGVQVYEQDWLITQMNMIPWLRNDLDHAESWFDAMIEAAHARGLTVQLCMASPEFFLQQMKHPNVTQVRASGDYQAGVPKTLYWPNFHQTSLFAYAVGLWPFKDNFQSSPGQRPLRSELWPYEEALISILSAGVVGPSDKVGRADVGLLLRTCRKDGLLLKPDRPAFPIDLMYLPTRKPWIVTAPSVNPLGETLYLAAFNLWPAKTLDLHVTLADLGLQGDYIVYDHRRGRVLPRRDRVDFGPMPLNRASYYVLSPVQPNGMALIGETGKFVTMAGKRFKQASCGAGGFQLELEGVPGERIELLLWAPSGTRRVTGAEAAAAGGGLTRLLLTFPESGQSQVEIE